MTTELVSSLLEPRGFVQQVCETPRASHPGREGKEKLVIWTKSGGK